MQQDTNLNNTISSPGSSNGAIKRKYPPRKALPSAVQSNSTRGELLIKGRISTTPKAVSGNDFPLFRTFILSPEADELFVKTTKNSIISLSTGDRFSSNTTGYLVIL
jgi:hypothetical protein